MPPTVSDVQNKGLCDVEKMPCLSVSLYSEDGDFTQIDGTTCKVVVAEVYDININNFLFEVEYNQDA